MTREEISALWKLLGQTWGAKFLEQYGTKPNDAWSAALAHVEPDAARATLQKLIVGGSAFPPTLPEFVAMARTTRPAAVLRHPILDHKKPPMSDDQVERRRREMYAALGKRVPK